MGLGYILGVGLFNGAGLYIGGGVIYWRWNYILGWVIRRVVKMGRWEELFGFLGWVGGGDVGVFG